MPLTLRPGVYGERVQRREKSLLGTEHLKSCFLIIAEKGEINKVVTCYDFPQVLENFGDYLEDYNDIHALKAFFDQGAAPALVVRLCPYTGDVPNATKASVQLPNLETPTASDLFEVASKYYGTDGNYVSCVIEADPLREEVTGNTMTNTVGPHTLSTVAGIQPGTILYVDDTAVDPTYVAYMMVKEVDKAAKTVTFYSALPFSGLASTKVVSVEVSLKVYYKGVLKERWKNLSLVSDLPSFIENVINDEDTGSDYITVTQDTTYALELGDAVTVASIPECGTTEYELVDGAIAYGSLSDADIIGSPTKRNGLYAFDSIVYGPLALCIPCRSNVAITTAAIAYCQNRGDAVFYVDPETAADTPSAVESFRWDEGNFAEMEGRFYYPWLWVFDPTSTAYVQKRRIPPSAAVLGLQSRLFVSEGPQQPAAGVSFPLRGVLDLAYEVLPAEQNALHPLGINCIKSDPGYGVVVDGARTLSSDVDWRYVNTVDSLHYLESLLRKNLKIGVHKVNDEGLWQQLTIIAENICRNFWKSGGLRGITEDEAFFVTCNRTNNSQETIDQGQVYIDIGVALQKSSEFIIFRIGQWFGGSSLELVSV